MPKFKKGEPRPASSGRRPGSLNKVSATFREAMDIAYKELGGDKSFVAWCRKNADTFYGTMLPRMIPRQIEADLSVTETSGTIVVHSSFVGPKPERLPGESLKLHSAKVLVWEHQHRQIYGEPGQDEDQTMRPFDRPHVPRTKGTADADG